MGQDVRNPALPAAEEVVGLVINGEAGAYPITIVRGTVVNDVLGTTPLAVAVSKAGTDWAFNRQVGDQTLTFAWDGAVLTDSETGSRWSLQTGRALSGPLAGERLEMLPERFAFWFSFVAAFHEATVYQPDGS